LKTRSMIGLSAPLSSPLSTYSELHPVLTGHRR
jgi:hypothetical protein